MGRLHIPIDDANKRGEDRHSDLVLLSSNFDLILMHSDKIRDRATWFFCEPQETSIVAAWVPGARLSLGVLLRLWESGNWLQVCPVCYGVLYVISAGGSVMSGVHTCRGICQECSPDCGLLYTEARNFLRDLYIPAMKLMEIYDNRPVIVRPDPQPWSWTKAPMYRPEPVPRRPIEPVSLAELIAALKGES
jgi:hypothetical protein